MKLAALFLALSLIDPALVDKASSTPSNGCGEAESVALA
jgi:hypothetical protein